MTKKIHFTIPYSLLTLGGVREGFFLFFLSLSFICMAQTKDGFSISKINDEVMARMQGKSFRKGCTVAREDLRYLTIMHYDHKGKVKRGEMVCNKAIAKDIIEIFEALYDARYPIEKVRLIDEYDGDDERSMQDNNSSSFNFRPVSGTKTLSRHALGMAVDINTLYNPYVYIRGGRQRVEPANGEPWARNRKKSRNVMIMTSDDLCVRLFKQHGFRWGGDWKVCKDYQHFEK